MPFLECWDGTLNSLLLANNGLVQQYCQNNRLQITGVRLARGNTVNNNKVAAVAKAVAVATSGGASGRPEAVA